MGNGLSQLTEKQIQELKERTPLSEEEMIGLLKRYGQFDSSDKGKEGIKFDVVLTIPELQANPVIPRLLELYTQPRTKILYAFEVLQFFALLSNKTPVKKKRQAAWACFDVNGTGSLNEQELFYMYKYLYHNGLSEDQILHLVHQTLSLPHLAQPGVLTESEFNQMLSDSDIANLFTVELQRI